MARVGYGYTMGNGKWAKMTELVLLASATKTESGTGTPVEIGNKGVACLDLTSTAKSGTDTPTLTVTVKTCKTVDGTFRTVASFTAQTATGTERKSFSGLDRFVRIDWTISGTNPSWTFHCEGEAK